MTHVYLLEALFVDPFTGFEGRPDRTIRTSNAFATRELADSRIEKFKTGIRHRLQVPDDYVIAVRIIQMEVIQP